MKIDEIEQKARLALENFFGEIPFISAVEITRQEKGQKGLGDFFVSLNANERRLNFLVEVKSSGQPRFAREAVNQFMLLKKEDRYSSEWGRTYATHY